ncbi:MAG TPA: V-type ATP synthase subunit A [Deltaproteobacteria bacterium]|nr:MAG: V-type ATP synthase subunit A [Deltaproteobacteria bacterium GWA2_55_82]OGQ64006.1 MAG: V-type ATP synthase subunit A [Deltaproteobacteria bacterium RIFCSPLOWO2_02_FULL_55_12]OIJ73440.1 MAG: V-type ATP synthase subunit A [Deltaproteobacteria bacterium GWC2_55_46]HBG47303.1 V-type ATP synthase subunit A [Deltaproteobacteria bacterium]HCY10069.1 V-type ATP synthase subunit A [Deltaproteobacteria bacterium]
MKETRGTIHGVAGPTVVVKGMTGAVMNTVCLVGRLGLLGEIIRIKEELVTLQVYEDTSGISVGEEVISYGIPLSVTLGPGLLTGIFDGIQRPLDKIMEAAGGFITRGVKVEALDIDRKWDFTPLKKEGDHVAEGDVLGTVQETERITHSIMVPPGVSGVIKEIKKDKVSGAEYICLLENGKFIELFQEWPVRRPRPFKAKLPPREPFITGQRVFDTLLPVADGGTAIVPGGFGTGKTVVEQTIAKFSRTDIVIYVGCGERGNEMSEILTDFPKLKDPTSGLSLSLRTVIVVNTSNMPVAAREASIFTGITIAEYFRDMGYSVAMLADSISRWAEALREISSRLEEMPGEEGFPPYLATQLGMFYERSGKVRCLGSDERTGSVTVISAVSPPGGDFSEPVTQASLRFAGALWALDPDLAYRRHFPAVNWLASFSLYQAELNDWFAREVADDMVRLRGRLYMLLQRQTELKDIIQIIGVEALQESDRLTLEAANIATESFLKQSAFSDIDAFNTYEKQYWMLKAIFTYFESAEAALKRGVYIETILENPVKGRIARMKDEPNEGFSKKALAIIGEIENEFSMLEEK